MQLAIRALPKGKPATLQASWTAVDGRVWRSSVPLRGPETLRGIDGMRFLWDMHPVRPARNAFFPPPPTGLSRVDLSVTVGGKRVAHTTLARRLAPPSVSVRRLTMRDDGLAGMLFTPRTSARRPGVVVFGGSEGGDSMFDVAALLAAHGYPALSLAYFGLPGLPRRLERIPLEYFARAVRVLRRTPEVDPRHVVAIGNSRGAEAATLVASTFPRLVAGAAALGGGSSVPPPVVISWTLHGRAVASGPVRVERIHGPVLAAGAGDELYGDSVAAVARIRQRLADHHFRFRVEGVTYASAGHLIGTMLPYLPAPTGQAQYGGTPRADDAAKADLWSRILRFLGSLR